VKKTAAASPRALAMYFLLGLGGCAPQIPDTLSADDVALSEAPDPADPADPADLAAAGRLRNCSPGTADCDRNPANDCEAVLADDPQNCGVCGRTCSAPNTDTGCLGGACRVIGCTTGYCDLDDDPENGCESSGKACPH
jgi:hypothetical protein